MIDEVKHAHPNVLLVQLAGVGAERAAEFAAHSGAEMIIPTHHDKTIDEAHVQARMLAEQVAVKAPNARVLDMIHGKWYDLGLRATPVGCGRGERV